MENYGRKQKGAGTNNLLPTSPESRTDYSPELRHEAAIDGKNIAVSGKSPSGDRKSHHFPRYFDGLRIRSSRSVSLIRKLIRLRLNLIASAMALGSRQIPLNQRRRVRQINFKGFIVCRPNSCPAHLRYGTMSYCLERAAGFSIPSFKRAAALRRAIISRLRVPALQRQVE